jgi:hypothetical protein
MEKLDSSVTNFWLNTTSRTQPLSPGISIIPCIIVNFVVLSLFPLISVNYVKVVAKDYANVVLDQLGKRFPECGTQNDLYCSGHILHPFTEEVCSGKERKDGKTGIN